MSEVMVFDDGEGIVVEIPIAEGITLSMFMDDEVAQQMVNLVQNKLNGRWNGGN